MRITTFAVTAALAALALPAFAADNEAGVPLTPREAAGAWVLESGGVDICTVKMESTKVGDGYAAHAEPACRPTLGGQAARWQPTSNGMRLLAADGSPLLSFDRWSNSLFVSNRGGADVQLRRKF